MKFGIATFPTDATTPPGALARMVEERGFESLWFSEHSHIPASRLSPFPAGGDLPPYYHEVLDPFVALAAAAEATETLLLGTGVCLVIQRDPFFLAKEVATLDRVSGGRFQFGIGAGWNREEMEDHGTDFTRRFGLMRERIEAMKRIWTEERAEYHGKQVDFDPILPGPRPVQKPHPPIHVGGAWPQGAQRAIRYGDGWIPLAGREEDAAALAPQFRQMAEDAGRKPEELELTAYGLLMPEADELAKLADAGYTRAVLGLMPGNDEVTLPFLDELVKRVEAVR
ncbi:MAG: LLM class F420-dependent oxidoreductase [Myxococcota bacterium]|nr:LLM class F420-dependent oxidoreductase [Myxococcota bacterium]